MLTFVLNISRIAFLFGRTRLIYCFSVAMATEKNPEISDHLTRRGLFIVPRNVDKVKRTLDCLYRLLNAIVSSTGSDGTH